MYLDTDKPLSEDPQRSFTLPSRWYTDNEVFELEKRRIFERSWHFVAHRASLAKPGDFATIRIGDENIAVIRGEDGAIRAFFNVCRHRAHELLDGRGNASAVVCPYHAWTYELDGRLRYARHTDTMPGFSKKDYCLNPVRVEDFCGLVFVNLDPDAVPLNEQAADLGADIMATTPWITDLNRVRHSDFGAAAIHANWKVVVDNYLECYHCNKAHPAFVDLICMDDYRMDVHGIWSKQTGPEIRSENAAYDVAPGEPVQFSVFWYLWPTTTINIVPGRKMAQVFSIYPLDIEHSSFSGETLTLDEDPDPAAIDYVTRILGTEDQLLCESVQRGLKSKSYNQGPFVVDPALGGTAEHALHHFHRMVRDALAG